MPKSDPLDSKRRRVERFRFEIEDPTEAQQAQQHAQLAVIRAKKDSPEAAAAQAQLDAARQALDECYGTVTLRALPPRVQLLFEQEAAEQQAALEREHDAAVAAAEEAGQPAPKPPSPPESKWDAESFEVRLIAACDVDGRSPQRWAEVLDLDGDWTLEDRAALLDACYAANTRHSFDPAVLGKGWAGRPS
jgi:hypothetical protein